MIRVTIITWLACIVFALYNALSIKQFTNTWQWHISQFASVGLFVFCGIPKEINAIIMLWKINDFHNFGEHAALLIGIFSIGILLYVYGLHFIEKKIDDRKI